MVMRNSKESAGSGALVFPGETDPANHGSLGEISRRQQPRAQSDSHLLYDIIRIELELQERRIDAQEAMIVFNKSVN